MIGPFGTDYINFDDLSGLNFVYFDGDENSYLPGWELVEEDDVVDTEGTVVPDSEPTHWYSGDADLLNTLIGAKAYVDLANPTLTIETYWDIEDYWDFGFVQISTDGGNWESIWTSLANEYTTSDHDPSAISTAVNNLPGLTSWSVFFDDDDDGLITMDFDLTAYAGQWVYIGFRYVTDWAFTYEGWKIYSATVSGASIFENLAHIYPKAKYMVTLLEQTQLRNGKATYKVNDMFIWDRDNFGLDFAALSKKDNLILVVSPIMLEGFTDYSFRAHSFFHRCHCCYPCHYHC
jgi:hypothetical protein